MPATCPVCKANKSALDSHDTCYRCTGCTSNHVCECCSSWDPILWDSISSQGKLADSIAETAPSPGINEILVSSSGKHSTKEKRKSTRLQIIQDEAAGEAGAHLDNLIVSPYNLEKNQNVHATKRGRRSSRGRSGPSSTPRSVSQKSSSGRKRSANQANEQGSKRTYVSHNKSATSVSVAGSANRRISSSLISPDLAVSDSVVGSANRRTSTSFPNQTASASVSVSDNTDRIVQAAQLEQAKELLVSISKVVSQLQGSQTQPSVPITASDASIAGADKKKFKKRRDSPEASYRPRETSPVPRYRDRRREAEDDFDPHRLIKRERRDDFPDDRRERDEHDERRRNNRRKQPGNPFIGNDRRDDEGDFKPPTGKLKEEPKEKEKPNFKLSGKLTEETNTYKGVVIKYSEPPEACKPKRRWRLYPFKNDEPLPVLHIHRQSAYLLGRDRRIADIPVDHPSCSKQHAILQFRKVPYTKSDGRRAIKVWPYVLDLGSANGTFVNNQRIDSERYVELREKDVIKFGFSSREYVLLHDSSNTAEVMDEWDNDD